MIWNALAIKGFDIGGSDGLIGEVRDILFDDKTWTTKWIVVHTGPWLFGRKVLIPLVALGKPDHDRRHVAVQMTKQQIKDCPDVDTDLPVSRHLEAHVYNYYDQNPFWHSGFSAMGMQPRGTTVFMPRIGLDADPRYQNGTDAVPDDGDTSLRSVLEVIGYHMKATDGAIGHLEDFLVDDADWQVKYITVDTKEWVQADRVVIPPRLIREIDWVARAVYLNVNREKIKASPLYNPEMTEDDSFDNRVHQHFWPTRRESDAQLNFSA
jgi:hypothetical protein